MPVEFDAYQPDQGRIDLIEGTNAWKLLSVLLEHRGVGFTAKELHDQTGVARGSVNPTLNRLEQAGLVRHKGDYWAATEDDRLAAASAAVLGLQAIDEAYEDDWYGRHPGWTEDIEDIDVEE